MSTMRLSALLHKPKSIRLCFTSVSSISTSNRYQPLSSVTPEQAIVQQMKKEEKNRNKKARKKLETLKKELSVNLLQEDKKEEAKIELKVQVSRIMPWSYSTKCQDVINSEKEIFRQLYPVSTGLLGGCKEKKCCTMQEAIHGIVDFMSTRPEDRIAVDQNRVRNFVWTLVTVLACDINGNANADWDSQNNAQILYGTAAMAAAIFFYYGRNRADTIAAVRADERAYREGGDDSDDKTSEIKVDFEWAKHIRVFLAATMGLIVWNFAQKWGFDKFKAAGWDEKAAQYLSAIPTLLEGPTQEFTATLVLLGQVILNKYYPGFGDNLDKTDQDKSNCQLFSDFLKRLLIWSWSLGGIGPMLWQVTCYGVSGDSGGFGNLFNAFIAGIAVEEVVGTCDMLSARYQTRGIAAVSRFFCGAADKGAEQIGYGAFGNGGGPLPVAIRRSLTRPDQ